jgi:glycosyltransferase involved in cell wall biosynthesis
MESSNNNETSILFEPNKSDKISLSALILTFNEEKHIARCIESLQPICRYVYIVDSFSTDKTLEIAEAMGVQCFQKKWENNHAKQFNWGLNNIAFNTEWVIRLDADEYILPELASEIRENLQKLAKDISGVTINRRVDFMDKWIRHGGYYPTTLLRIWRTGAGFLEERWMDEHVKLEYGNIVHFKNDLVDHNLNNLTWWTNKHNNYAIREVVDFLIYKFDLSDNPGFSQKNIGTQSKRKRWFKEKIYFGTPLFVRPFVYFFLRYILQLGFLDGKQGLIWHFLQGFWYRFLVDAKVYEIYKKAGIDKLAVQAYLQSEYKLKI